MTIVEGRKEMDIMTGMAALSQALNIAKGLREIEKGFDASEFKLKIADLYSSLADAKVALADAKTENEAKQTEIDRLVAQFRVRSETIEYKGFRYEKGKDGKPIGCPFCPRCETTDGRMIRTTRVSVPATSRCPQCKESYGFLELFPYPEHIP
jgi:hypothetical protein